MAEDQSFLQALRRRLTGGGSSLTTEELRRLDAIEAKHTAIQSQAETKQLYSRRHAFRSKPSAYTAIKYYALKHGINPEDIHICIDDLFTAVYDEVGVISRVRSDVSSSTVQPAPAQ
jgi:hypothetical protein